jgi:hypothetical protein
MSHGGRRAGSGRKRSGTNRLDTEARAKAMETGITPLDYMLAILRDGERTPAERMEAGRPRRPTSMLASRTSSARRTSPSASLPAFPLLLQASKVG